MLLIPSYNHLVIEQQILDRGSAYGVAYPIEQVSRKSYACACFIPDHGIRYSCVPGLCPLRELWC